VRAARAFLADSHQQLSRAIAGTLQSRRQAELARQQSEVARVEAEKQKAAAETARRALEDQQAQFDKWVSMVSSLQPGHRVLVRRFDREGIIVRMLLHKQMAVVSVGAMELEVPIRDLSPVSA
jgi:hypothetical protein